MRGGDVASHNSIRIRSALIRTDCMLAMRRLQQRCIISFALS